MAPVLLSIIVLYCFLLLAQVVSAGQGKWVIGIGGGLRPGRRGFRRFLYKKSSPYWLVRRTFWALPAPRSLFQECSESCCCKKTTIIQQIFSDRIYKKNLEIRWNLEDIDKNENKLALHPYKV